MANNFTLKRFKQVQPSLTEEQLKRAAQKLNINVEGFDVNAMRKAIDTALDDLELPFSMEDITPKPAKIGSWMPIIWVGVIFLAAILLVLVLLPPGQLPVPTASGYVPPTQLVPTPAPPASPTQGSTATVPPTARPTGVQVKLMVGVSAKVAPKEGATCFKQALPPNANANEYKTGKGLGQNESVVVLEMNPTDTWTRVISFNDEYDKEKEEASPCWVQGDFLTVLPKPVAVGAAKLVETYDPVASANPLQPNGLQKFQNGVYQLLLTGMGENPNGLLIFVNKKPIGYIFSPNADNVLVNSVFGCKKTDEVYTLSVTVLGGTNSGAHFERPIYPCK